MQRRQRVGHAPPGGGIRQGAVDLTAGRPYSTFACPAPPACRDGFACQMAGRAGALSWLVCQSPAAARAGAPRARRRRWHIPTGWSGTWPRVPPVGRPARLHHRALGSGARRWCGRADSVDAQVAGRPLLTPGRQPAFSSSVDLELAEGRAHSGFVGWQDGSGQLHLFRLQLLKLGDARSTRRWPPRGRE